MVILFLILYPWPLAPQDGVHPITGTFCECRGERDHFHNGIDIPLTEGGDVLSVSTDVVLGLYASGANSWIRVGRFAYVHVVPNPDLEPGDTVHVGDVVGVTNWLNHIHFKDGGGASGTKVVNPLLPGRLSPVIDNVAPTIAEVRFYLQGTNTIFPADRLTGCIDIVIRAYDGMDYGGWNNGVYKVGYQILAVDTVTPVTPYFESYWFDTLPNNVYINDVYAPGSNTSTYYYYVTNHIDKDTFWNTAAVAPGDYVVGLYVADVFGNQDTLYKQITVVPADTIAPHNPYIVDAHIEGGELYLRWRMDDYSDVLGYRLYHSFDGIHWECHHNETELSVFDTIFTFEPFPGELTIYFYVTAVDSSAFVNESHPSPWVGVRYDTPAFTIWSDVVAAGYPGVVKFTEGIELGFSTTRELDTCTDVIIYLKNNEVVQPDTLTQGLLHGFVHNGGKLVFSGSNILQYVDSSWLDTMFGCKYLGDTIIPMVELYGEAEFAGIGFTLPATNWCGDTLNLCMLEPTSGEPILRYSTGDVAAVKKANTMVFGFPIEEVEPIDPLRSRIFEVLGLVGINAAETNIKLSRYIIVRDCIVLPIERDGHLPSTVIYDVLGQKLPISLQRQADKLRISFRGIPAGVYFLHSPHYKVKVLLIR